MKQEAETEGRAAGGGGGPAAREEAGGGTVQEGGGLIGAVSAVGPRAAGEGRGQEGHFGHDGRGQQANVRGKASAFESVV